MKLSEKIKERVSALENHYDFDIHDREAGRLEECWLDAILIEEELDKANKQIEELKKQLLMRELAGIK